MRFACLLLAVALPTAAGAADEGWLDGLRSSIGLGGARDEFLHPDAAFVVSAEAAAPDRITTHWRVADGYYLYTRKFSFSADNARLGPAEPPVTAVEEDPYFGRVPIAAGSFAIDVPVAAAPPAGPVALVVGYQGCAKDGICYPPMHKTLQVSLPGGARSDPPAALAAVPQAPASADAIAEGLAGRSLPIVLASFYGFGLLLAFTPCVLPMVPILSGLVVGQGATGRRALLLSATYVLAMALVYAAAGVLAGLSGQNLQAAFQHPALLGTFAAVFVLLALAMLGAFHLQLPAGLQSRATVLAGRLRGGSLGGVAAMGALSAVIVGPCVAPPLAGALLYIAASGDALVGGAALFALALGMGTPLVAVGTSAGHWLPRAGPWTESVRRLFAVILLGVAVWLVGRVLPGPLTLVLWGVVALVAAALLGAFDPLLPGTDTWRRLGKAVGVAVAVWGVALLAGAGAGGDDPLRPFAGLGTRGERPALPFVPVKGPQGLTAALAGARARGRPAMLDLYADWCIECKQLERTTFADASVRAALAGVELLKADVTANDAADRALLTGLGLFGPPALLFFGPDGRERRELRVIGYVDADGLLAQLGALGAVPVATR